MRSSTPSSTGRPCFSTTFPLPCTTRRTWPSSGTTTARCGEFFRDIWWPDMQSRRRAVRSGVCGAVHRHLDDIVIPEDFLYQEDSTEQYFDNSLLQNGYEMGAHGYNHQSLAGAGEVPEDLGYNAWAKRGGHGGLPDRAAGHRPGAVPPGEVLHLRAALQLPQRGRGARRWRKRCRTCRSSPGCTPRRGRRAASTSRTSPWRRTASRSTPGSPLGCWRTPTTNSPP